MNSKRYEQEKYRRKIWVLHCNALGFRIAKNNNNKKTLRAH